MYFVDVSLVPAVLAQPSVQKAVEQALGKTKARRLSKAWRAAAGGAHRAACAAEGPQALAKRLLTRLRKLWDYTVAIPPNLNVLLACLTAAWPFLDFATIQSFADVKSVLTQMAQQADVGAWVGATHARALTLVTSEAMVLHVATDFAHPNGSTSRLGVLTLEGPNKKHAKFRLRLKGTRLLLPPTRGGTRWQRTCAYSVVISPADIATTFPSLAREVDSIFENWQPLRHRYAPTTILPDMVELTIASPSTMASTPADV